MSWVISAWFLFVVLGIIGVYRYVKKVVLS